MPISIRRPCVVHAKPHRFAVPVLLICSLAAAGCTLTPAGLPFEQERLAAAGNAYEQPAEQRALPMPASGDDWGALLHRALLVNGELEAAYFQWKAAVERVQAASAWPNANVAVSYSTMFEGSGTFGAGFDAMENLSFPTKTMKAGAVALDEARAAAERFRTAKFSLQKRVLDAWLDLVLAAERERIAHQRRELAGVAGVAGLAATSAGASDDAANSVGSAIEAQLDEIRAGDEVASATADIAKARATLAAMAALGSSDHVSVPTRLPVPRDVPGNEALLSTGASANAELAEKAAMLRGRDGEVDLARMQWIPDINPAVSFDGIATQTLGIMAVLPTTIVEIRSSIAQAESLRSAAAAELRQGERDRTGEFVATLVALRNAERSRALLEDRIVPAARNLVASSRTTYVSGKATLGDLTKSHQVLLEARDALAEAAVERERRVAELESLAGIDMEAIHASAVALSAAKGGGR